MHRARAPGIPVLILALPFASACGESAPRYTLQQVMYQVDYLDKALTVALQNASPQGEATRRAEELAHWWQDGAFTRHLESAKFTGDRASFAARQADFARILGELSGALATGDMQAAGAVHERLRASCDACHAEFRPQLLLPAR